MRTLGYTFWKDEQFFIGHLNDYPDYETQALSKDELVADLKALLEDVESGEIPYVRKVEEFVVV